MFNFPHFVSKFLASLFTNVGGQHFNQNLYAKVVITQNFRHICSLREHGCSLGDAPTNSSRDPKVGSRVKQQMNKKVGARSLIHNILGIRGRVGASRWD